MEKGINTTMTINPSILFSVIHPSARPNKWREIYDAWINAAVFKDMVEYILVADPKFFSEDQAREAFEIMAKTRPQDRVIWTGVKENATYVSNVNLGAKESQGRLLFVIADDQYPAPEWDAEIASMSTEGIKTPADEFVVEVNTLTPDEHDRGILVLPILSRSRYERFGYVFFPEYESMYADNDFCALARRDECVIDLRHIAPFPHRHPMFDPEAKMDEAYSLQNRPEAYEKGAAIFEARKASNFNDGVRIHKRRRIAVCLPGERFSMLWVSAWTGLLAHLLRNHEPEVLFGYSSSVYVTRASLVTNLIQSKQDFDFVLWLDDDNTLTPAQLEMMIADLDDHPELAGVAGWTWVQTDGHACLESTVSCGTLNEIGQSRPFTKSEMESCTSPLKWIDWSGFPALLLRFDTLKADPFPFRAEVNDNYSWGMAGEDVSFFIKMRRHGLKFAVDRRVYVPHYKMRAVSGDEIPIAGSNVIQMPEPQPA
jgi:glycosyltransferase involved in cell wall biosynthesis